MTTEDEFGVPSRRKRADELSVKCEQPVYGLLRVAKHALRREVSQVYGDDLDLRSYAALECRNDLGGRDPSHRLGDNEARTHDTIRPPSSGRERLKWPVMEKPYREGCGDVGCVGLPVVTFVLISQVRGGTDGEKAGGGHLLERGSSDARRLHLCADQLGAA